MYPTAKLFSPNTINSSSLLLESRIGGLFCEFYFCHCYVVYRTISLVLVMMGFHLTHWGRVTHICISELTIIGSDNGLSPGQRQAIIWTNAGILLIEPLGTNFSEILNEIHTLSFKKMHLKMSSAKWRPFCLGLNVLTYHTPNPYCMGPWILLGN